MVFSKKSIGMLSIMLTMLVLPLQSVQAESNVNGKLKAGKLSADSKPTIAADVITISTWLSPTAKQMKSSSNQAVPQSGSVNKIAVKSGSAIPLKFRLFNGSSEIKSTDGISIAQVAGNSCTFNGKSTSNSGKAFTIRYTPNGFETVFKSDKNSTGCFKFQVKKAGSVLLTSPEFTFDK